jgi:hypothetical protein
MPNFGIGQMVQLRSGKTGRIRQILVPNSMAHLCRYQVALEPGGQLIGINGVEIMGEIRSQPRMDLFGRTLDGYRVTGISYGADRLCKICGGGIERHELFETELSQAAAMEVLTALMLITNKEGAGALIRAEREARFMFGVLISANRPIIVAGSGRITPPTLMKAMTGDGRFTLVGDVITKPILCRGGREVDPGQIKTCEMENQPLCCAAPKLVDYANRHGYTMPYHMTEVWFDPKTFRKKLDKVDPQFSSIHWKDHTVEDKIDIWMKMRLKAHVFTDHGDTRESCNTCKGVLPLLLCGAKPPHYF